MNDVKKDELTGFRSATQSEQEWIAVSMKKEIRRELRPINFWLIVCAVLAGSALFNLLTGFRQQSLGYYAVSAAMFFGSGWGMWELRKAKRSRKIRLKNLDSGAYSLMDCRMYDVHFPLRSARTAYVKIYGPYDQYCTDFFPIETSLGRLCQEKPSTALILMKCGSYYKILEKF